MPDGLVKRFWQEFVKILSCIRFHPLSMMDFVNIDTKRIMYVTMIYSAKQRVSGKNSDVIRLGTSLELP